MWRDEDEDSFDRPCFTHWDELGRRWQDRFGGSWVKASELMELAIEIPGAEIPRDADGKPSVRQWGRLLSDGDYLEYDGPHHTERGSCYRLTISKVEKQSGHCDHKTVKCLACGETLAVLDGRIA